MSEKIHVVTDVPAPSFLKRIPVKKVAIATLVVAAVAAVGVYAKENVDVDVVPDTETSA